MSLDAILDEFMAGLVSGAVLLVLGYLFVEKRFHLADRRERETELLERRKKMSDAVKTRFRDEVIANERHIEAWQRVVTGDRMPELRLDTSAQRLLFEPLALEALPKGSARGLVL